MNILQRIVAERKTLLEPQITANALAIVKDKALAAPATRGFANAIVQQAAQQLPAVIAQPTKASPSQGVIRDPFELSEIIPSLENAGASCISILTDEKNFQGGDHHLIETRQLTNLPILCKDFIFSEYQVYNARAIGADAILLMASVCSPQQLQELTLLAHELDMSVLAEIHDPSELQSVIDLPSPLVGINNRNLKTLNVDIQTSLDLVSEIPTDKTLVSESGIHTREQADKLRQHGIYSFLIGESLMRVDNPGDKLAELFAL